MSKLYLQVISGLGSRIRPVLGAIAYCEATGRDLVIDWLRADRTEKLKLHDVRLDELWTGPYRVMDSGSEWAAKHCNWHSTDSLPAEFDGDLKYRADSISAFVPYFKKPMGRYFLDNLTTTPALQEVIDQIMPKVSQPVLGVHIRYSLCQPETSPVEWFIERARQFPEHWLIYVATDDGYMVQKFEKVFGKRVLSANDFKTYHYDRRGIFNVAAEWFLLKDFAWMIGSNRSSYSQVAAWLRGAERTGSLAKRWCSKGGRYEDFWNPPDQDELAKVLNENPS